MAGLTWILVTTLLLTLLNQGNGTLRYAAGRPGVKRFQCHPNEFRCTHGSCIPRKAVCDGFANCPDASDEILCKSVNNNCKSGESRCNIGTCIWRKWICDGSPDCPTGEDELNCPHASSGCAANEYSCLTGECYPKTAMCDGTKDCPDGEDEWICPRPIVDPVPPGSTI